MSSSGYYSMYFPRNSFQIYYFFQEMVQKLLHDSYMSFINVYFFVSPDIYCGTLRDKDSNFFCRNSSRNFPKQFNQESSLDFFRCSSGVWTSKIGLCTSLQSYVSKVSILCLKLCLVFQPIKDISNNVQKKIKELFVRMLELHYVFFLQTVNFSTVTSDANDPCEK